VRLKTRRTRDFIRPRLSSRWLTVTAAARRCVFRGPHCRAFSTQADLSGEMALRTRRLWSADGHADAMQSAYDMRRRGKLPKARIRGSHFRGCRVA